MQINLRVLIRAHRYWLRFRPPNNNNSIPGQISVTEYEYQPAQFERQNFPAWCSSMHRRDHHPGSKAGDVSRRCGPPNASSKHLRPEVASRESFVNFFKSPVRSSASEEKNRPSTNTKILSNEALLFFRSPGHLSLDQFPQRQPIFRWAAAGLHPHP